MFLRQTKSIKTYVQNANLQNLRKRKHFKICNKLKQRFLTGVKFPIGAIFFLV